MNKRWHLRWYDRLVIIMTTKSPSPALRSALELHDSLARSFATAAERVPAGRWYEPLGEGKWTPAQVAEHLLCTYDTILLELHGGAGMRIRTRWWQRLLLRLTTMPKILAGRGIPEGARAPRETRPSQQREQRVAVDLFLQRADEFRKAVLEARPAQRITHAYFGKARVAKGVLFCARHIEHHIAQLPAHQKPLDRAG